MPTNTSNALGTARQFMPQPESTYQPRVGNVAATQASTPQGISSDSLLAVNLNKLDVAFSTFTSDEDKRQNEIYSKKADDLLAGKTPKDLATLSVVDMAQQAGLGDMSHNPYFLARADRIKGEMLSTRVKQDYDDKFGLTPAASVDEEQARYQKYTSDWKADNLKSKNWNQQAFDEGFTKNQQVNEVSLANTYVKQKVDESAKIVYANTQANLAHLTEQAPTPLKTNGEFTKQLQTTVNDPRLMGLDPNLRLKLVDDFMNRLVKTGTIGYERIKQMADSVTVQTNRDGTTQKLSDVVDTMGLKEQAANYQMKTYTKERDDRIKKYSTDKDMTRYFADAALITDPIERNTFLNDAEGIKRGQAVEAARIKAETNERNKASMKAYQSTASKIYTDANYTAYMNGVTSDSYGNNVGSILVPKGDGTFMAPTAKDLQDKFNNESLYIIQSDMSDETKASMYMKMASYPPFNDAKKAMVQQFSASLRDLSDPTKLEDANGNTYVPENVTFLSKIRHADPANFLGIFGQDIDQQVARLNYYTDVNGGDLASGAKMYAMEASTADDVKEGYKYTVRQALAGSTISGIHQLGGGESDNADLYLSTSGEAQAYTETQALGYMCGGMSYQNAAAQALNDVQKGFSYYHGALMPRGIFNAIGTNDNEGFARQAIYSYMGDFAEKSGGVDTDDITMRYNADNQSFTFVANGQFRTVPLSAVINQGKYLADNQSQPDVTTSITTAEINGDPNAADNPNATPLITF